MYTKSVNTKYGPLTVYFGFVAEKAKLSLNYQHFFKSVNPNKNELFCIVGYSQPILHADFAIGIEAIDLLSDTGSGLIREMYKDYCTSSKNKVACAMVLTATIDEETLSVGDFLAQEIYSEVNFGVAPTNTVIL